MAGPAPAMMTLGLVSYANNWYNTKDALDIKPLVYSGVALLLLEAFAAIPGMEEPATWIGWLAVLGMCISPVQNPSPAQNLLKIAGANK